MELRWNKYAQEWQPLTPRQCTVVNLGLPVELADKLSLEDVILLQGPLECVYYAFNLSPSKHKLCTTPLVEFFKTFKVRTGNELRAWADLYGGIMNADAMEWKLQTNKLIAEAATLKRQMSKFLRS